MRALIEEYENFRNWDVETCKKFIEKSEDDPRPYFQLGCL
jgi:hypothetical protein